MITATLSALNGFQSTLPRGERRTDQGKRRLLDKISIHAPARGATTRSYQLRSTHKYFNPRSREGSDKRRPVFRINRYRFQSTLPRGERRRLFKVAGSLVDFNPRSREGSDQRQQQQSCSWQRISIHAPARGATQQRRRFGARQTISIHAPARGATNNLEPSMQKNIVFQSTLPRGERQNRPRMALVSTPDFNPRSREGSDHVTAPQKAGAKAFQSTLPRGERQ